MSMRPVRYPKFVPVSNGIHRTKFTPELWAKWLEARIPDERTQERLRGIHDMRARLRRE